MMAPSNELDLLPPELFDNIMFLVGCESPEVLDICRQVCRAWNEKIMNSLKVNPSKKWGAIIGRRFELSWAVSLPSEEKISTALKLKADGVLPGSVMAKLAQRVKMVNPTLPEVTCAASLAHKGMLGTVKHLRLDDINLLSVPAQHLASLVSSVTLTLDVAEVRGDLVTILDNVRSEELYIVKQSLGTEETEALVRAMETRVEAVELGDLTLEMETLTKYSGHGKCNKVMSDGESDFYDFLGAKYREELRSWATSKGWYVYDSEVEDFDYAYFVIQKD